MVWAIALSAVVGSAGIGDDTDASARAPLLTRWSALVDRSAPHPEHPRPQLVRDRWMSLNGPWEYAIRPLDAGLTFPATPDGTILVPYPLESPLSGVAGTIGKDQRLLCRRTFTVAHAPGQRVLLHFEAVDWGAKVFLNGRHLGDHTGGFEPFSFDITDALRVASDAAPNELLVTVWDPCDEESEHEPPRGKQVRNPSGIWYTSVTGIWQTVWLEWVPERSIERVTFAPRLEEGLARGTVEITPIVRGDAPPDAAVDVSIRRMDEPGGAPLAQAFVPANRTTALAVPNVRPWSPESPQLYRVDLRYGADSATSYVAFRTIEVRIDGWGVPRILLNGSPYFMLGLLDQGWWPDGLYTAPTYDAMTYDIEVTKALGYNTIRKHVKVEPATWYAACDRIGLLVWQDMPSSGPYIGPSDPDATRGEQSKRVYESELLAMVGRLSFFPSIVMWVPFNEGWGQFDTWRIARLVKSADPGRLVNAASGWADRGVGDVYDLHDYSAVLSGKAPPGDGKRANVLGEFGGLGLALPGHLWRKDGWGYRSFKDVPELTAAYGALLEQLPELAFDGVSGAIYTQTTDVEIEINGVMTYDRDVLKMNSAELATLNRNAIARANELAKGGTIDVVVSSGYDEQDASRRPTWRWTEGPLPDQWWSRAFDDRAWQSGPSGFGTEHTPGAVVGTTWTGKEIAIRRRFTMPDGPPPTHLAIHHDEDAEVWLDGVKIATLPGYTTGYARIPLTAETLNLLTPGEHVLAIRCVNTSGGQYIDAGFVRVTIAAPPPSDT